MAERRQRRRSMRTGLLDSWQSILDETKNFVDDRIEGLRDDADGEDLVDDVDELKQAVAELNAKLDRMPQPTK